MSDDDGWRSDPAWRLVQFDPGFFDGDPPAKPPEAAELAQPDAWASLYDGRRLVAVWTRADPSPPSAPASTIAVA